MTTPATYPACERCGQHPRVIRHVGGTETVLHLNNLPCEAILAAYSPAKAQAMWRAHSQE